jgi:hypothetical protein
MGLKRLALAVAAGLLVATTACATERGAPSGPAISASSKQGASITAHRQVAEGDSVRIDAAKLVEGGYVGVYEDDGGAPGRKLGASSLLSKGTHRDVIVHLRRGSRRGARVRSVFVVLHAEDNGNKHFDFPSGDAPVDGDSGVVLIRIPLRM